MRKILIISATREETEPFYSVLENKKQINEKLFSGQYKGKRIDILVAGIGIVPTIYNLTKHLLSDSYDLLINAGIAGCSDSAIKNGETVEVVSEEFADFGVVSEGKFISASDYSFIKDNSAFKGNTLINPVRSNASLPKVKARTIHTIDYEKRNLSLNTDAVIETMEGAAFFYVCLYEKILFFEFRSVSNRTGDPDKKNWQITEAIVSLNSFLKQFISDWS